MEGPTIRNIPAQHKRICGNCKYLKTTPMVRGHFTVTDNYNCLHPSVDFGGSSLFGAGRCIAFNAAEEPPTPEWCPFLTTQKIGV